MTRQRVNHRLITIARLTEQDASIVQAAIDHLHTLETEIHLWPASLDNDGTHGSNTILVTDEEDTLTLDDLNPALLALLTDSEQAALAQHLEQTTINERVTTTTVEREIIRINTIRERRRRFSSMIDAYDGNRKDIREEAQLILRTRDDKPEDPPRCDGRHLDGYELAQSGGGWSDPTCTRIPRSGHRGPCDACYMRHVRWRKRNNRPPLNDTAPPR